MKFVSFVLGKRIGEREKERADDAWTGRAKPVAMCDCMVDCEKNGKGGILERQWIAGDDIGQAINAGKEEVERLLNGTVGLDDIGDLVDAGKAEAERLLNGVV